MLRMSRGRRLITDRFELDELKKVPERLKRRNACKQLGRKEKRRVRTELPRILSDKMKQWLPKQWKSKQRKSLA